MENWVEKQGVTRRKKRKRRKCAAMFLYCFRGVVQPRLSNINNKDLCLCHLGLLSPPSAPTVDMGGH